MPRRATLEVIRRALEKAGVEFIDENGGGPGVRLRRGPRSKAQKEDLKRADRNLLEIKNLAGRIELSSSAARFRRMIGRRCASCLDR